MPSYEKLGWKLALFNVLQNICKRMNSDASGMKTFRAFLHTRKEERVM